MAGHARVESALECYVRKRVMLGAWCEGRRGYGVAYIGARASTTMETNHAPSWLRYTEDQEDAREDWGPAKPGCCGRTMGILWILVLDYDSTVSQCDRAKMHLIKLNQEYSYCIIFT